MGEPATEGSAAGPSGLREGLLVANKYRLVEQRGSGGMGTVWSANHVTLGHTVAIKFLHGAVMANEESRSRFEREARLAARLGEASRHITRVIDHGVLDDGTPYLVMELLQGDALSTYLKREKIIPLAKASRIVQHLARALHVAHSAGVIHRDLKPANVFLCSVEVGDDVFVKLLDFGVAKATLEHDDDLKTGANQVLGTPSYMSPEQILSESTIDGRSDLWAVAAMVYRMTVGRPPFGGGQPSELGLRILSTEHTPPSQVNPALPHEFDMWMARGLAKKPADRFQTARELADFLNVVAGITTAGLHAEGNHPAPDAAPAMTTANAQPTGDSNPGESRIQRTLSTRPSQIPFRARRRTGLMVLIGLGALLMIGVIVALVQRRDGPTTDPTARSEPTTVTTYASAAASVPSTQPSAIAVAVSTAEAPRPSAIVSTGQPAPVPPKVTPTAMGKKKPTDSSGWANKKEL